MSFRVSVAQIEPILVRYPSGGVRMHHPLSYGTSHAVLRSQCPFLERRSAIEEHRVGELREAWWGCGETQI